MQLTQEFKERLDLLKQKLGSDFAIISYIKGQTYTVVEVASELATINKGDQFVTKDTYCNEVIYTDQMITYPKVGAIRAMVRHPIYTALQLEAYIGEPLHHHGCVVGTLNFSGFDPKQPSYTNEEIDAVKALARDIEQAMEF